MKAIWRWWAAGGVAAAAAAGALATACGGETPAPKTSTIAPGGSKDQNKWPADDHSMCDWKNHPELEIIETAGPGAYRPNVRRVFKWAGEKEGRKRILLCREIDTNLDGIKDVVRTYETEGPKQGEPKHEEADTDYDGKIDTWVEFADGRIANEATDTRHAGSPDICKFYLNGSLSRIRRNTHCKYPVVDCRKIKPTTSDTWEIYSKGQLVRIGVDNSCDGHVDRWDRDTEKIAQQEAEAQREAAAKADAGGPATALDAGPVVWTADGGGSR